jgi:PAS domain S-box-containing protein
LAARGTNDGIWDWDIATGKESWSVRFKELLVYGDDEIDATFASFLSLLHPDDLSRTEAAVRWHFGNRKPFDIEFRMRKKSGDDCWFHSRGQAVWDAEGNPVRMAGSIRDISERKHAEHRLKQSEERFRMLVEQASDGIFISDGNGCFLDVNRRGCEMTGFSGDENLTMNIKDFVPEEDLQEQPLRIDEAVSGKTVLQERRMKRKDGSLFSIEVSAKALPNGILQSIVRDISERKRAEQEREKLIEELENRNAEMERFTYTISHDLKSPLITIKGFLGILEDDIAEGNRVGMESDISRISGATDRMVQLLDELLELSRVSRIANPHQNVSLAGLAENAVELRATQISESEIQADILPDLPVIHGDQVRLQEVM